MVSRRIASGIASPCFYAVAIPLAVNLLVDPSLDAKLGWTLVSISAALGTLFGAYAIWTDHFSAMYARIPKLGSVRFPSFRRGQRREVMMLSRVVEYVSNESEWLKSFQSDPEHVWVGAVRQEIKDQFSSGRLKALGRRRRYTRGNSRERTGLTWLPEGDWERAWFLIVTDAEGDDERNSVWIDHDVAWDDVRVSAKDVRSVWRPLSRRDKETLKALHATLSEGDRDAAMLNEYIYRDDHA